MKTRNYTCYTVNDWHQGRNVCTGRCPRWEKSKVVFDRLVNQQPTSFLRHVHYLPKLFRYLFVSVFYCRV